MAGISELINVQKISTANIYLSKRQSSIENAFWRLEKETNTEPETFDRSE